MNKRFKLPYMILPATLVVLIVMQGFSGKTGHSLDRSFRDADTVKTKEAWPASFNLGRQATPQEIARVDIDVRPDGQGLPAGSGNVKQGQAIYLAKCLMCHTARSPRGAAAPADATASLGPALITDSLSGNRVKTIGNYWPYASTVYDYINRAMPYNAPGSLTANEVYSLTAYLLHANKIIPADAVMNAKTLPKVKMPAETMFVPDDRVDGPEIR